MRIHAVSPAYPGVSPSRTRPGRRYGTTWTYPCNRDGCSAIITMHVRIRDLTLRFFLSPPSMSPWALRSSSSSPPHMEGDRDYNNKVKNEGWEALKVTIADMFYPMQLNLFDMLSLRTVYNLADYQIGMLFGAFLAYAGCYQLWRVAPSIFVDAVLGYMIYKLSVISSELHRLCKSNSLVTRLKFGIILFMILKDFKNNYVLLDAIRMPLFLMYLGTFIFDVAGLKKYGRRTITAFVNLLKTKGGIKEIFRIVWYPGYVSPYIDYSDW